MRAQRRTSKRTQRSQQHRQSPPPPVRSCSTSIRLLDSSRHAILRSLAIRHPISILALLLGPTKPGLLLTPSTSLRRRRHPVPMTHCLRMHHHRAPSVHASRMRMSDSMAHDWANHGEPTCTAPTHSRWVRRLGCTRHCGLGVALDGVGHHLRGIRRHWGSHHGTVWLRARCRYRYPHRLRVHWHGLGTIRLHSTRDGT